MATFSEVITNHFGKPPHEVNHEEKYGYIIDLIGMENVVQYIPYNKPVLLTAWDEGNIYFNGKPFDLTTWGQAGFRLLKHFRHKTGIIAFSLANATCVMKEAARICIKEYV